MGRHPLKIAGIWVYYLFQSGEWHFPLSETVFCNSWLLCRVSNIFFEENQAMCDSSWRKVWFQKGRFPESSDAGKCYAGCLPAQNLSQSDHWCHYQKWILEGKVVSKEESGHSPTPEFQTWYSALFNRRFRSYESDL